MKKRWIILGVIGFVAVLAVVISRRSDQAITVTTITLEPCRVEQTISCTGVVETADATMVMLPINCAFSQVMVKAGDRVSEGDVLAVVDKEATRKSLFDSTALMTLAAMPEEITAPQNGTIMEVKATPHQVLDYGTPCIVMAADEDLQIRIAIREKDLRTLKKGMTVRVTGDGFEKPNYNGELIKISSAARTDEAGTVVEGLVALSDEAFDPSLRLGLTAKAAIVTAVTENGYIVPYEAVQTDEEGSYVYVLNDGQAQRQGITVAAQVAQGVLLTDATLAQKQIVRDAECITNDGQKVTARGSDT